MSSLKTYDQMLGELACDCDEVLDKLVIEILSASQSGRRHISEGKQSLMITLDLPFTGTELAQIKYIDMLGELQCKFKKHEVGKTYPSIKKVGFHPTIKGNFWICFEATPLPAAVEEKEVATVGFIEHRFWTVDEKERVARWFSVPVEILMLFLDSGHHFMHIRNGLASEFGGHSFGDAPGSHAVNVEREKILEYHALLRRTLKGPRPC